MDKKLEERRKAVLDLINSGDDEDMDTSELSEKEIEELNRIASEMLNDGDADEASEDIYFYLDLAYNAGSRKKRIEYAEKALSLEPDNVDAMLAKAMAVSKEPEDELAAIAEVVEKAGKALEADGYFENGIGSFWAIWETRPYMRARAVYCNRLIGSGKLRLAEKEAKELLVLSESDNLGMRFTLSYIYMHLEDEDGMKKLIADYPDSAEATDFLLPLAALYYKLGNLTAAAGYLAELTGLNPDAKVFIKDCASGFGAIMQYAAREKPFAAVRYHSIEELVNALIEYTITFAPLESFFRWAVTVTKRTRKKKTEAKK